MAERKNAKTKSAASASTATEDAPPEEEETPAEPEEEEKEPEPEVTQKAYRRTTGRVKSLEERVDILQEAIEADLGIDLGKAEERLGQR